MFVQLYTNPSRWLIAALVVFGFELLFHVIAFCSTDWFSVTWNNKTVRVGLWRGCWNEHSSEVCSNAMFDTEAFNTDSAWHNGTCILMVCSLMTLVCVEAVLIGHACFVRLRPYSDRMVGVLSGMLIVEVPLTGIVLLMVGSEVSLMKDGRLSWAYGLEVLCLVLSIVIVVLIYINKHLTVFENKNEEKADLDSDEKNSFKKSDHYDNPVYLDRRDSTEYSGSVYTSEFRVSSNDVGTFEKNSSRSVTGSVSFISDVTKSTGIVSYSQEPSRRSSLDSYTTNQTKGYKNDVENVGCINQSPDPILNQSENDKHYSRKLSRKSSSSVESVV